MRVAVMGAGGLGGFLAAKLAAADQEVVCIARGAHLGELQAGGLTLIDGSGRVTVHPIRATDAPSSVGPVDVVLFCVKLYDVEEAAHAVLPLLRDESVLITLQNGVEHVGRIAGIVGETRTVGGAAVVSARVDAPGVIRQVGSHATIECGSVRGEPNPPATRFVETCRRAGIDARVVDDVHLMLWTKFARLAPSSAITTLVRRPIGEVRGDPALRSMLIAAVEEVASVGRALGVDLPGDAERRILAAIDALPPSFKPSQLIDLERGRRLEVEWTSGAVCRLGRRTGVPTPTHSAVYTALRPFAAGTTVPMPGY